ncbi:SRPBCC domain-containing protein [Microbacterium sp. 18062]|uniref:SRPBCC family protein n=1 Tax=Microbacterium sp. 18062 TaxID=2681410 RepID=UPI00190F2BB7|nr:SRPBCC family protein [Microbacterium sp. 18062]
MSTRNTRIVRASPEDVFAVLGNGWLIPAWVVGATRMRSVDAEWPNPGASIHHSLGVWPFMVDDQSEAVEWSPPHRLRLRPRAGLLGRGIVVIDVAPHPEGSRVRMTEEPVSGAAMLLPRRVWRPLLTWRNREALLRLAYLAEGHAHDDAGDAAPDEPPAPTDAEPSGQARADAEKAQDAHDEAAKPDADDPPRGPAHDRGVEED